MKRNSLLFVSILSLSLTFFSSNAIAANSVIESGLMGILAGKVYDFIFGTGNSSNSSSKECNSGENYGKNDSENEIEINK